jgi:hypothetical protein
MTIKPGTRCECRGCLVNGVPNYDGHRRVGLPYNTNLPCVAEAVRLVTDERAEDAAIGWYNEATNDNARKGGTTTAAEVAEALRAVNASRSVPMCQACSEWHEKGRKVAR